MINKIITQACLITGLLITVTSCDPFSTHIDNGDIKAYAKQNIGFVSQPDTLKIMTWNIKFGGGRIDFFFDCFGNRSIMDSSEVLDNLKNIALYINHINPDILLLQEVDINSKRCAYIDQVEWLMNNTAMNYAFYVPQWKARFIPSNSLGRMNSGIAILSKTPLSEPQYTPLPLRTDQSFLVRYFYLRRGILTANLNINNSPITVGTTHLEAYAQDGTKKIQVDMLADMLNTLNNNNVHLIFGGDFNCLPPGTQKVKGFPDSVCEDVYVADDYSAETHWMIPFYQSFHADTPLDIYQQNNAPYFTHSVDKNSFWNRKIDYIFSNKPFVPMSGITHQTDTINELVPMVTSDHCPISVQSIVVN